MQTVLTHYGGWHSGATGDDGFLNHVCHSGGAIATATACVVNCLCMAHAHVFVGCSYLSPPDRGEPPLLTLEHWAQVILLAQLRLPRSPFFLPSAIILSRSTISGSSFSIGSASNSASDSFPSRLVSPIAIIVFTPAEICAG